MKGKSKKGKVKIMRGFRGLGFRLEQSVFVFLLLPFAFSFTLAQTETPPKPAPPKSVKIPAVKESNLPNNLTVAVAERKNVPLVTVQLLVRNGAANERLEKAGLANLTASLLTKGTRTRTATQIAEEIEFLGGSINAGAGWNSSIVSIDVMSDKLDKAMEILSDVVLNPAFRQEEIDLLRAQTLDSLTYNLQQPSFLANYVASRYSFGEHPATGTPESLRGITRADITAFHANQFKPQHSVLIFAGDITSQRANALARKFFGKWKFVKEEIRWGNGIGKNPKEKDIVKRILVVDLPNAGQASVNYARKIKGIGRDGREYYPAIVLNSVLGGGYSSRLNQEIRIKRGLSYGAGSSFAWRAEDSNFSTRTQTKNESAGEVAELVIAEVKKLSEGRIEETELIPRKSVLTGNFGRNLETTAGLAAQIADLYLFGLPTTELNSFMKNVQMVSDPQIRGFAGANLFGGDLIIVGDYAKFRDDLSKRFPGLKIEVVKAGEIDITRGSLRKPTEE